MEETEYYRGEANYHLAAIVGSLIAAIGCFAAFCFLADLSWRICGLILYAAFVIAAGRSLDKLDKSKNRLKWWRITESERDKLPKEILNRCVIYEVKRNACRSMRKELAESGKDLASVRAELEKYFDDQDSIFE